MTPFIGDLRPPEGYRVNAAFLDDGILKVHIELPDGRMKWACTIARTLDRTLDDVFLADFWEQVRIITRASIPKEVT